MATDLFGGQEERATPNEADIETIYKSYPRHIAKKAAKVAIRKALTEIIARNGEVDSVGWLLGKVEEYARCRAKADKRFTPYPASWFNAGRYDDDPAEWNDGGASDDGGRGFDDDSRYDD